MGPPAINNTPAGVRFPLTKLPDLPLLSASQLPEPPSPAPALWPNWRVVCISGEQILPLAWEFNGCPFQRLRIAVTHLQEVGVKLWEFLSAQLESSNQSSLGLALRFQPLCGFCRSHLTGVWTARTGKGKCHSFETYNLWMADSVAHSTGGTVTWSRWCFFWDARHQLAIKLLS